MIGADHIGADYPTYSGRQVEQLLDYRACIDAVREAMQALSASEIVQPLRNVLPLGEGRLLGLMPGLAPDGGDFAVKVISVVGDPSRPGRAPHQGVVVLFDGRSGAVRCVADAGAITTIRTACATAVATAALARADSRVLAIFGTGTQARAHLQAMPLVRNFDRIIVWGRSAEQAAALATEFAARLGRHVEVIGDAKAAATVADVICTVTGAATPVLLGEWLQPGTHVNLVGSSIPGPVEVDAAVVVRSRYIADYRRSALAAAAEFLAARQAGLVDNSHVVGEIGEVLAGRLPGRRDASEITVYKSLGHIVQDLAATALVHRRATESTAK